ncbi:MAG: InlB B-repeat-containing protein [Oscillospiraceae bacterium]|nr:InlB B-repeat-containing protein [Oscillospiraceae bacterium]
MTKTKKRMIGILTAASMVMAIGAADAIVGTYTDHSLIGCTASAAGEVSFVDEAGYIRSESQYNIIDEYTGTFEGGWYVAKGNVTIDSRIYSYGTVNIILENGCRLIAKDGINIDAGGTLNIYTQNGGSGTLYAGTSNGTNTTAGRNCSGIGGDDANINIIGGKVYAKGGSGAYGISGSSISLGWTNPGDLVQCSSYSTQVDITKIFADRSTGTVYDIGTVTASNARNVILSGAEVVDRDTTVLGNGTYVVMANVTVPDRMEVNGNAALILTRGVYLRAEKGITVANDDSLTIYGTTGKLYAGTRNGTDCTADDGYAGLGAAAGTKAGTVTIDGGTVYANGGRNAAGLGGADAHIEINNGTVTATGGTNGAGIGSGYAESGSRIDINGGNVTAYGGDNAAGIGNGADSNGSVISLNWTKSGDSVYASSYRGDVRFLRDFIIHETNMTASKDNIDNKTLTPTSGAYTITFETNGGSPVAPMTAAQGQHLTLPAAPIKNGCTFSGWYLDKNCTKPFEPNNIPINKDYVLYAKWTAGSHTVSFNTNGGSYIDPVSVPEGGCADISKAPVRTGYTFGGWYTDSAFNVRFDPNARIYSDIMLYAKWTASQVTVTFETNGGSYTPPMTVNSGEYLTTLPGCTRNGYAFAGWYLNRSFTQKATDAPVTKNTVLYAKWTENISYVTVNFDPCGGSYVASQKVQSGSNISDPYCYRDGYRFTGWWQDSAQAGSPYDFSRPVTADMTLYAGWESDVPVYYNVRYITNGGSYCPPSMVRAGTFINDIPAPVMTDYVFDGWFTDADCTIPYDYSAVNSDITLYARWTQAAAYVTVTFDPCGGTYVASQTVREGGYISEPTCYREGYIFTGWWENGSQTGSPYSFGDPVNSSKVLYAGWVEDPNYSGAYYYGSSFGGIGTTAAIAAAAALISSLITAIIMKKRK